MLGRDDHGIELAHLLDEHRFELGLAWAERLPNRFFASVAETRMRDS